MEKAIKVENLCKKYRIGERLPYKTIREDIIKLYKREKGKNDLKNSVVSIEFKLWSIIFLREALNK